MEREAREGFKTLFLVQFYSHYGSGTFLSALSGPTFACCHLTHLISKDLQEVCRSHFAYAGLSIVGKEGDSFGGSVCSFFVVGARSWRRVLFGHSILTDRGIYQKLSLILPLPLRLRYRFQIVPPRILRDLLLN